MPPTFDINKLLSNNLPSYISDIEIRTRFTPPIKMKIADLLKPADQQQSTPLTSIVKPTVIINGPAFKQPQIIAPGGVAAADEWKVPALAVAVTAFTGGFVIVSTIFGLGAWTGKRRAMRGK